MNKPLLVNTHLFRLTFVSMLSVLMFSFFAPSGVRAQKTRQLVQEESDNQEKRTALVIGNGSYADSPLKNPVNDATDIAATLKSLGFEVFSYTNLDQNAMKKAIRDFGAKLRAKGGVGMFYYAGHGVQVKGTNYLIPVSAQVNTEEEVEYESVEVGLVLAQMEAARNNMNIVILDACRNNPFARSYRSAEKGLASIDAPSGTFLAYATAPGSVASDGAGRNGLYTQELLKSMKTSGLSIENVFKRVRISVRNATQDKQTPWESSSLTGEFFFAGGAKAETKPGSSDGETAFWKSIENSADAQDFEDFLKKYPDGVYAPIAENKLRKLNQKLTNSDAGEANKNDARSEQTSNPATKPVPKVVSGGVVNDKATKLVQPPYPAAARAVRASGAVNVQVTIDENGNVISASATSGHPLLRQAAEQAARASKFVPTLLSGQPVKVTGVIVYTFIP